MRVKRLFRICLPSIGINGEMPSTLALRPQARLNFSLRAAGIRLYAANFPQHVCGYHTLCQRLMSSRELDRISLENPALILRDPFTQQFRIQAVDQGHAGD